MQEFLTGIVGADVASWLQYVVALLFVILLLLAAAWLFRSLRGIGFRSSAARGRQPRLQVMDSAPVDGRRRLLLIRRDNVEHLIMIGGPSDIVVEQTIFRGQPPTQQRGPAQGYPQGQAPRAQAPRGQQGQPRPQRGAQGHPAPVAAAAQQAGNAQAPAGTQPQRPAAAPAPSAPAAPQRAQPPADPAAPQARSRSSEVRSVSPASAVAATAVTAAAASALQPRTDDTPVAPVALPEKPEAPVAQAAVAPVAPPSRLKPEVQPAPAADLASSSAPGPAEADAGVQTAAPRAQGHVKDFGATMIERSALANQNPPGANPAPASFTTSARAGSSLTEKRQTPPLAEIKTAPESPTPESPTPESPAAESTEAGDLSSGTGEKIIVSPEPPRSAESTDAGRRTAVSYRTRRSAKQSASADKPVARVTAASSEPVASSVTADQPQDTGADEKPEAVSAAPADAPEAPAETVSADQPSPTLNGSDGAAPQSSETGADAVPDPDRQTEILGQLESALEDDLAQLLKTTAMAPAGDAEPSNGQVPEDDTATAAAEDAPAPETDAPEAEAPEAEAPETEPEPAKSDDPLEQEIGKLLDSLSQKKPG